MRHIFFGLAWILYLGIASLPTIAQQQTSYDSVALLIKQTFNTREPLNTYLLANTAYQQRINATAFTEGMSRFYARTGQWITLKQREILDSAITYTAVFENDTQVLFLRLDRAGKIAQFNFQAVPVIRTTKPERVVSNNPMTSAMDSLVEQHVRPYIQQSHTSGICIAVIDKGITKYYSYGETARGNQQLPDPEKTIFEIGSVTKTFTSLLLARALIAKQVNLHDPVSKYLPKNITGLQFGGEYITLEHLSNHTAGLPRLPENIFWGNVNPKDPYSHYRKDSLFSFLQRYQSAQKPGTKFAYSNLGAGLLGYILSQRAHQSFEQLIINQVCKPLKMSATKIELNDRDSLLLARGYDEKGEVTPVWNLASLQGSGAIRSTVSDMAKYTKAQLGIMHSTLDKAIRLTHQTTFTGKDNIMGLGWRVALPGQTSYLYHSGGTGGFRSFVAFDKKRQLGIVIMSNTAEDVTHIGQAIMTH